MQELQNQILCGDCVEILRRAKEPFADLVFADPPFNIGYKYDKYQDEKASEQYLVGATCLETARWVRGKTGSPGYHNPNAFSMITEEPGHTQSHLK